MNCKYHPDRKTDLKCSHCREPLCDQCALPQANGTFMCSRCIALAAAQDVTDGIESRIQGRERNEEIQEARVKRKRKIRVAFQWGIVVTGLVVIAIQMSETAASFKEKKPLRYGTYQTDAKTDQCIKNLWKVARLLQEGKMPEKEIYCPASKEPYVITEEKGDIVARSPHPEFYGFKEIRVSKNRPVPEVIK